MSKISIIQAWKNIFFVTSNKPLKNAIPLFFCLFCFLIFILILLETPRLVTHFAYQEQILSSLVQGAAPQMRHITLCGENKKLKINTSAYTLPEFVFFQRDCDFGGSY